MRFVFLLVGMVLLLTLFVAEPQFLQRDVCGVLTGNADFCSSIAPYYALAGLGAILMLIGSALMVKQLRQE